MVSARVTVPGGVSQQAGTLGHDKKSGRVVIGWMHVSVCVMEGMDVRRLCSRDYHHVLKWRLVLAGWTHTTHCCHFTGSARPYTAASHHNWLRRPNILLYAGEN